MLRTKKGCEHLEGFTPGKSPGDECAECVKKGSWWVHLRTCQTCGVTLCCDSSPKKHATQHFKETGHPVVISAEDGERWAWCYTHESMVRY